MLNKLMEWMRSLYTPPSADVLALQELEESKRRLLEAQSGREYADSMCKYHEAKIRRLTIYLQGVQ